MTGLQTVPCHIAGMWSGIVLLEENFFFNSERLAEHVEEGHHPHTGLQFYGGPESLSHDFRIWSITFQGSGPGGPIFFLSCDYNKEK